MEIIKRWLQKLLGMQHTWLILVLVSIFIIHLLVITQPATPLFDEQHYVPDARSIIQGNGSNRMEHPPLGKLLIVSSMLIFGDNPFGWRFFSIVFGTLNIFLFYLICRQSGLSRKQSYIGVFLMAFENMGFVQASVAMLDVYNLTFMLLSFWLYLRGNYLECGIAGALAALVKLTGVFAFLVIGLHWLISRRDRPAYFVGSLALAWAAFVFLMVVFNFAIFRHLRNPLEDISSLLGPSASLTYSTNTHPSKSRPWDWIILPLIMPYWYTPHYMGAISFTIWALIIPTIAYMIWIILKQRLWGTSFFVLCWFIGTYLIYIPLVLITDRVTYVYYFYPTIGAICLGLAFGLSRLLDLRAEGNHKISTIATWSFVAYLTIHVIIFIVIGPFYSWKFGIA